MKKLFSVLVLLLASQVTVASAQTQNGAPTGANANANGAQSTAPDYFSQHFSADALNADVKSALATAGLAPVSFNRIILHSRDQLTSKSTQPEHGGAGVYSVEITLENAGHGLIRRQETAQAQGAAAATRLSLTYRGYFPFMTQTVPADRNAPSPAIETRKVLHFDPKTEGHMAFAYLYGAAGEATFADPGQVICNSGKRYEAAKINAAIQGQALELDCQAIDTNGMVTNKMTFAYLEKYGVALALHMQNQGDTLDSTVTDFTVQ